ncbi:tetratricopeptide repeat protein [Paucibacter sp. KCTC 42545]|uniref:tetratricopeptide repeat protein n=1 Tax=Paucibacter sp. KCTC 42545 TaxID=1768242 RepID=UPI000733B8B8|nr:hypothetical protein [Paucibacter sp. KCTC 42545]ALT77266.1 hypothetical protein AT984_08740 [Paucibacter sp. KCTC 42545]
MKTLKFWYVLITGLSWAFAVNAQTTSGGNGNCGPIRGGHYGPYDYRPDHQKNAGSDPLPHAEKRVLVEGAHFTPRVENLIGAQSGGQIGSPGPDLSYTLRAFPNNHRALVSVMRYGEKFKTETPPGLQYPVECYFERAIRFAGNDSIVRIIYATYLTKKNRLAEAKAQLNSATQLAADNAFTHYNIGLAYYEMKEYGPALESAHRAIALGFDKPDLREKLIAAGQWQDPVVQSAETETARDGTAVGDAASSPKAP